MPRWSAVSLGRVFTLGAAAFGSITLSSSSASQPFATNSGTLTCTVADVPSKASSIVDLSCNYKSIKGAEADYVGSAGTKTGGFPPAKFVFVWNVVVLDAGKAPLLEGTFTAESGREGAPVLIGGKDGSTRLEPLTEKGQVPGAAEITNLTLELAATKT
jgi:hypothetical protein